MTAVRDVEACDRYVVDCTDGSEAKASPCAVETVLPVVPPFPSSRSKGWIRSACRLSCLGRVGCEGVSDTVGNDACSESDDED